MKSGVKVGKQTFAPPHYGAFKIHRPDRES